MHGIRSKLFPSNKARRIELEDRYWNDWEDWYYFRNHHRSWKRFRSNQAKGVLDFESFKSGTEYDRLIQRSVI